jgi:predicted  nucleic acid-binding Zn-ribbon protein
MHKCVRCGKIAASLEDIDAGCPCGSKVFVFGKEDSPAQEYDAGSIGKVEPKMEPVEPEGKVPSSYYARMSFATEDVENIKVLSQGVFVLDVNALSRDPMVLKDEDGIYYVKIPFEQRKGKGKNGKK